MVPADRKVSGLIPGFSGPCAKVSLGNILNPKVPLMMYHWCVDVWMCKSAVYIEQALYECVYDLLNVTCSVRY